MKRKHGRHHTVYEEVEVLVSLDDFTDEAILEEATDRGLIPGSIRAEDKGSFDPKVEASDAMQHLMCRRLQRGEDALRVLVEKFVPPQLLAALDFTRAGHASAAICEIDRYIDPAPAATCTALPVPAASRLGLEVSK